MKCPDCHNKLQIAKLKGINIHECLKCNGKWFERKQLYLYFDPFDKDVEKLCAASDGRQCPQCSMKMQSLRYLQSKVTIEKCQSCEGVWLSHAELGKIILYLEKVVDAESVKIFTKQKGLISEVRDFLAVLRILEIRIAVEHPHLAQSWQNIESISPFK